MDKQDQPSQDDCEVENHEKWYGYLRVEGIGRDPRFSSIILPPNIIELEL